MILDRDGVLNFDSDDYIRTVAAWRPIPGSLAAVARLKRAGYRVAVATNQSAVGRGLFSVETLHAIHAAMRNALALEGADIDAIAYCPHTPDEACACRKPRPGMLHQLARTLGVDLRGAIFVGDTVKDVLAARAVGARPLLVRTGKPLPANDRRLAGVPVYDDLAAAVDALLSDLDIPAE